MELKQLRSGGVLTQLLAQLGEKYEPERLSAALKERELEMAMRAAGVVASFGTWIARVTAVRAFAIRQLSPQTLQRNPGIRSMAGCHGTLCRPAASTGLSASPGLLLLLGIVYWLLLLAVGLLAGTLRESIA